MKVRTVFYLWYLVAAGHLFQGGASAYSQLITGLSINHLRDWAHLWILGAFLAFVIYKVLND